MLCINYTFIIIFQQSIIIMKGSNILFYSSNFLCACGRVYSKFIDNLGIWANALKNVRQLWSRPFKQKKGQKRGGRDKKNDGSWSVLTFDRVQWQVLNIWVRLPDQCACYLVRKSTNIHTYLPIHYGRA